MWWIIGAYFVLGPGLRQLSQGLNDLTRHLESKVEDGKK